MNSTKNCLCSVFRWFVPPWFWIHRWLKDQDFLVSLQSRTITPSLLAYPVWLILSGFKLIKKSWGIAFRDYGMQRYSTWIGEHYGPMGRGYFNYERLSDQEKLDLYGEPRGRIEYFLNILIVLAPALAIIFKFFLKLDFFKKLSIKINLLDLKIYFTKKKLFK